MVISMHSLMQTVHLYVFYVKNLGDRPEVTKCRFERGRLPVVFGEVPLRVTEALEVRSLRGFILRRLRVMKTRQLRRKR